MKKINFRQPKYTLPAILYLPILFTAYFVIDIFNTAPAEAQNPKMQTVDSLNEDIPEANVGDIDTKEQNMEDYFGKAKDTSAVAGIDQDTVIDKESRYQSRYNSSDLREVNRSQNAELRQLRRMQARTGGGSGFVAPLSERERRNYARQSNRDDMAEIEQALSRARRRNQGYSDTEGNDSFGNTIDTSNGTTGGNSSNGNNNPAGGNTSSGTSDATQEDNTAVVKKAKSSSDYFHTISSRQKESCLIRAIVDENIKAVEGSRLRLRLLDDIEVDGSLLKKGTYLYAQLSGFGSQRVKGKIGSVLVDDQLTKINLSIYDMDGLEGFYVPESQFRETTKDIGSSAFTGGTNMMESTTTGNSVQQWATQAVQNAYQRTTSAISKALKKNRVSIKYGTQVYLLNGSKENNNKNNQNKE